MKISHLKYKIDGRCPPNEFNADNLIHYLSDGSISYTKRWISPNSTLLYKIYNWFKSHKSLDEESYDITLITNKLCGPCFINEHYFSNLILINPYHLNLKKW